MEDRRKENIWRTGGRKTFGGPEEGKHLGEEDIWVRKDLTGPEASKGGGKHLEAENICGRKDSVGGNHMGEEKNLGEEDIWVRKDLIG